MKKAMLPVFLLMALAVTSTPIFAEELTPTYVNLVGHVDSYGVSPAHGWLGVHAKVGEWAKVHVFWMPFKMPGMVPGRNYTYSFYAAKLVNTSIVELNYTGLYDFYISGLWDAYNVTWVYYGDGNFTLTIEQLVDDAFGELYVTGNWMQFAVSITDLELISGTVKHYCMKPFVIPIGDVTGPGGGMDRTIDIWDLIHVAKAYGNTPGMGRYDFDIDFNFDFKVDVIDLVTIAANLGETY